MTSLVAQTVKRLSTMQETGVRSLGREDPLEKEIATHSSTITWKIPWTEEPNRLHVVHGVAKSRTRLSNFTFTHWRRKWRPTPVFLPGESQGWGSLVGCHLWGRTESDTTEVTQQQHSYSYLTTIVLSNFSSYIMVQGQRFHLIFFQRFNLHFCVLFLSSINF